MNESPWDPSRREEDLRNHGVDFEVVRRFDWSRTVQWIDDRRDYGEERVVALAPVDGRLHVLVNTVRDGEIRVISLRKANRREQRRWAARTS